MGRCEKCNKETGWGGGNRCLEHPYEYYNGLKYGDRVELQGFYVGTKATIADETNDARYLLLQFDDGTIKRIHMCNIKGKVNT